MTDETHTYPHTKILNIEAMVLPCSIIRIGTIRVYRNNLR